MTPDIDRKQVRQHFSEHAGEYDLYARVQKRVAARLLEQIPDDHPPGPILDVGTGTGEVARRYVRNNPGARMVVSDIAHDMTRAAHGHLPTALPVDADAQALPFADNAFPLVLSASVFQWIEDFPALFAEMARVVKPGGLFAFALFCDGTLGELRTVFGQALQNCSSDRPNHFQEFPVLDTVAAALAESGLDETRCHVEIETDFHPSFRDLMRGLKRIGAQNASQQRPTGMFPRRVMREMERLYVEQYHSEEGLPASYGVLYGFGRKPS